MQRCLDQKIMGKYYHYVKEGQNWARRPKPNTPYWREVVFARGESGKWGAVMGRNNPNAPSNGWAKKGNIRPDLILLGKAIIEIKFPGDSLRPTQMPGQQYDQAAIDNEYTYHVFDQSHCPDCDDEKPGKERETSTADEMEQNAEKPYSMENQMLNLAVDAIPLGRALRLLKFLRLGRLGLGPRLQPLPQ